MHSFPNSLSIETTLSIEFTTPSRALQAQFGVGLNKKNHLNFSDNKLTSGIAFNV